MQLYSGGFWGKVGGGNGVSQKLWLAQVIGLHLGRTLWSTKVKLKHCVCKFQTWGWISVTGDLYIVTPPLEPPPPPKPILSQ